MLFYGLVSFIDVSICDAAFLSVATELTLYISSRSRMEDKHGYHCNNSVTSVLGAEVGGYLPEVSYHTSFVLSVDKVVNAKHMISYDIFSSRVIPVIPGTVIYTVPGIREYYV